MAPTPAHDGPAKAITSFYADLLSRKLSLSPPFSLATVLNLEFFHDPQANVGTHEGADKYPDLVSGFQVDGVKYLWDVLETAKSQGLYTHFGGETINKEGVMNKVSNAVRLVRSGSMALTFVQILEYTLKADSIAKRRAVAPIVSIDCFRVEEVPPIGFGSEQWSYSVRPKKDHPFVLDSIKLDTPAFDELRALKKSLFPGTGRVRGSRENLTPGPGKLRATTEDLIPDAGPFYGATASGRPRVCFSGGHGLYWIHAPLDDNKAIDLVVRGIAEQWSISKWLETDYAIVCTI